MKANANVFNVYQCPVFNDLFGGSDLKYKIILGIKHVFCPVCGGVHHVNKNNQILEGEQNGSKRKSNTGTRSEAQGCSDGKEYLRQSKVW